MSNATETGHAPSSWAEVHRGADSLMRLVYTLHWIDKDGRYRGQVFHADPRKHGHDLLPGLDDGARAAIAKATT